MAKTKTAYVCQNCGVSSPKWIGKCSSCGEWNTYVEEIVEKSSSPGRSENLIRTASKVQAISEISYSEDQRIASGNSELDRVLGGGLVPGSLVLVGGEPGIGKSTLLLQVSLNIQNKTALYVSGEESPYQIKMRAERIAPGHQNCLILGETLLEAVLAQAREVKPDLLIIDSIQTLRTEAIESAPGSVAQVRECAAALLEYAKTSGVPVLLIGHITKEGRLAGPKTLEHIVDAVLQFEGDQYHMYRILRSIKNRFGSTSEIGIYEMLNSGLREVPNPSELLLSGRSRQMSGTAVAAMVEGARPLLIEVQALVSTAAYSTPQRSCTGFDTRRLNMLLAVLEKRAGFRLAVKDVFLNIAGGLKVSDPAIDMAVLCAVLSSGGDIPVRENTCFAGEVGLSGEIRPVNRVEQRIAEAEKLGFKEIFVSSYNKRNLEKSKHEISIRFVEKMGDLYQQLFRN